MDHYITSLNQAAILADFERRLRDALKEEDGLIVEALAARYLPRYAWLADDFYRKVYLRGRRRALAARIRTYDRLLAGHNPKTVRYLSEGWRHQREEAHAELRELEGTLTLTPPPWPDILALFRAQLQAVEGRGEDGTRD